MFFLKYGAFKIISAEDICLSAYGVRLNDERTKFPKNGLACFKLRRCKLKLKIIMNFFFRKQYFFLNSDPLYLCRFVTCIVCMCIYIYCYLGICICNVYLWVFKFVFFHCMHVSVFSKPNGVKWRVGILICLEHRSQFRTLIPI